MAWSMLTHTEGDLPPFISHRNTLQRKVWFGPSRNTFGALSSSVHVTMFYGIQSFIAFTVCIYAEIVKKEAKTKIVWKVNLTRKWGLWLI